MKRMLWLLPLLLVQSATATSYAYRVYLPLVSKPCATLADDFSDPTSGWADDYYVWGITYEYTDSGEYHISVPGPPWWVSATPGWYTPTDFTLSADVRTTSDSLGTYGLAFGITANFYDHYSFEIDNAGNYYLWRYFPWRLLASGNSDILQAGTNNLRVTRTGVQIDLYANDVLLDTVAEHFSLDPQRVGVAASTRLLESGGLDAYFDNFTLSYCEPVEQAEQPQAYFVQSEREK